MENESRIQSKSGKEMLDKLRKICVSLPEVEEIVDGFGHKTCKVNGKSFIMALTEAYLRADPKRLVKQLRS